jgi:hypothetical protein
VIPLTFFKIPNYRKKYAGDDRDVHVERHRTRSRIDIMQSISNENCFTFDSMFHAQRIDAAWHARKERRRFAMRDGSRLRRVRQERSVITR